MAARGGKESRAGPRRRAGKHDGSPLRGSPAAPAEPPVVPVPVAVAMSYAVRRAALASRSAAERAAAAASDKPLSVRAAMRAGALGYVLKDEKTSEVRTAIKAVAAGTDWISPRLAYILAADDAPDRPALSPQETRALQLYATGMPVKSVARRMAISEETVKQYVSRVREKYARAGRSAPTKLELYYRAVEDGHLPPHPAPRIPPLPVAGLTGDTRPRPFFAR
jgi:DNA-binding NarL/FixJ family response regulator